MPPAQLDPPLQTDPPRRTTRAKQRSHSNRKNKRKMEREAARLESKGRKETYKARSSTVKKHIKPANPYETQFDTTTIPIASSGYVSVPGRKSSSTFPLKKLVGPDSRFKMEKVVWDGKHSIPIVDKDSRIFGLCAGADASDWNEVHRSASIALEDARSRLSLGKTDRRHRRGRFVA
ncbi:uncharacterized protein LACBIDRAFT_306858 [Laccaria bicolor S238N-H82]|uniref:Predicted protein n=1 Tax=Laccaria bicolor (strain S238N-H82 / ATCC MYA-4686) TaxID=486041 RepID=B0DNV9_LACBS|nr:uncharacterized protein LACBIDRAFT_306858 [Laccaria bicolor S238N-H82]EDR03721.1 predicted protein [Laccaria bicolor S238N-H82]|eukprot:XP_001885574.1 predicted protein [Laccaria bicolor S238N-H82]